MKICPQCQTAYTNDSLQFCLQDGAQLISQASTGDWSESETLVSPPVQRGNMRVNAQDLQTPQSWARSQETIVAPPQKSNTSLIVTLTALATLAILGGIAVGTYLFMREEKTEVTQNTNSKTITVTTPNANQAANVNSNTNASPTPSETPMPKPTLKPKEVEIIKSDVGGVIDDWKNASEGLDLDAHMSNYAETVDYYKGGRVNVGTVREDKQRAFENYNNIKMDISNMKITPDETGEKATAVFDKEWTFEGEDKYSTGKVQQQLQLSKIGGKWRITSEKDMKVYYVDK